MRKNAVPLVFALLLGAVVITACTMRPPFALRTPPASDQESIQTGSDRATGDYEKTVRSVVPTKGTSLPPTTGTGPRSDTAQETAGSPDTSFLSERNPAEDPGQSRRTASRDGKRITPKKSAVAADSAASPSPHISVLLQNDGASEEDLTSILTEDFLGRFDIPVVLNDAVQYFVRYFSTEKRKVLATWLRRSRRYAPMMRSILREQGLPEDLLYLAMIESGFNPKAYSSMKACGPWQFIHATGGRYGLKVDHWVDQRRDPEKSTIAAALYLKDLFNQFGNWYLAAAGYNAGEKRIERAVEMHETTDFWEISKYNTLPRETRDYIPRLIAAAIIAKDPEKFGFAGIVYDEPIKMITEKIPGGIPLVVVARAATCDVTAIRHLNPEILTGVTPPTSEEYLIKLPESTRRETFRRNLQVSLEEERQIKGATPYSVKKKDSIHSLTKRYGITTADLILVNHCDVPLIAKPGRTIHLPLFTREQNNERQELVQRVISEIPAPRLQTARERQRDRSESANVPFPEKRRVKQSVPQGDIRLAAAVTRNKITVLHNVTKPTQRQRTNDTKTKFTKLAQNSKRERVAAKNVYRLPKKGEARSATASKHDTRPRGIRKANGPRKDTIKSRAKLR
jgi:membrane-bound lytic murein transglycosylase D